MTFHPPSPVGGPSTLPPPRLDDLGRPPSPPPSRSGAGRTLLLVIGGALAFLFIAQGLMALLGVWFRTSTTSVVPTDAGVTAVRIDVDAGTVRLTPGETLGGQRTDRYGLVKPSVAVRREGGTLVVEGRCARVWLTGSWCSTSVTLTVPRDVAVTVHSGAGDVHLGALTGTIDVSAGAGDVTLTGTAGSVVVETGAGSVRGTDLSTATVEATSGAGDVRLAFASPPANVRAESGAGGVTVVLPSGETPYRVDADSGAGSRSVEVRTSPAATALVYAHSGAGDVTVRYGR
jgi:Putative adhesin